MKRALPWLIILLSVLAVIAVASRLPGRELVREGAAAWNQGDVPTALQIWQEPASSPLASPAIHFNLGAAYYRDGDIPRALAHWRQAHERRPRDPALVHNIALARSQLDGIPEAVGPVAGWQELVSPLELGLLSMVLLIAFSLLLLRAVRDSQEGLVGPIVTGLIGAALGAVALHGAALQHARPMGVVVDSAAVVRDAPSPQSPERDALPPGTEVRVLSEFSDFVLITTGEEEQGWVPAASLWSPQRASSRGSQASAASLYRHGTPG